MMTKKSFLLLLAFFIPILAQNPDFPVRAAGYLEGIGNVQTDLPTFCQRAKNAGYNYVFLYFPPNITPSAAQAVFQKVDDCGMRTIPQISLASLHDFQCGWGDYSTFPLTNVNYMGMVPWNGVNYPMGSTSFADETSLGVNGIDCYIVKFLQNIKSGFQAANLKNCAKDANGNKYLDYVHLGHDEAVSPDGSSLIAGLGLAIDAQNRSFSATDRAFITNYLKKPGKSTAYEEAFRALFADELCRRVKQVQNSANFYPLAKVMIFSDMWDPLLNGGTTWNTYIPNVKVTLAPNKSGHTNEIIDLPGLSTNNPNDKALVQNNVIHMPWNYGVPPGGNPYSFLTVTNYFINAGMKYLALCCDINATNAFLLSQYDGNAPIDAIEQLSIDDAVSASRLYPSNYVGYFSMPYSCIWNSNNDMYNQVLGFETEEYLQKMERPSYTSTIMRSLY